MTPQSETWSAQCFDTDIEDWEDMDEVQPSENVFQVLDEARREARKCAYSLKVRVVSSSGKVRRL